MRVTNDELRDRAKTQPFESGPAMAADRDEVVLVRLEQREELFARQAREDWRRPPRAGLRRACVDLVATRISFANRSSDTPK